MSCYAKNVVETALSEVGYKETGTNRNKFAEYIDKNYHDFYNGKKNGYQWCDLFVDYCVLVNSANEAEALKVLCQPKKSAGAGCRYSYQYYKQKKRTGKEPKFGAQIFFGTGEYPTHTGIVVQVTDNKVITVEGNADNKVQKKSYSKNSSKIYGYGYPIYTEATETPVFVPNSPLKTIEQVADEVIAGKWGNGAERKARLIEAGYNYDEVQAKVNQILNAKTPAKPAYTTYTVKKGDTLWQISQKYLGKGSRYKEIKSLNGLKSDIIHVGQMLKLPPN